MFNASLFEWNRISDVCCHKQTQIPPVHHWPINVLLIVTLTCQHLELIRKLSIHNKKPTENSFFMAEIWHTTSNDFTFRKCETNGAREWNDITAQVYWMHRRLWRRTNETWNMWQKTAFSNCSKQSELSAVNTALMLIFVCVLLVPNLFHHLFCNFSVVCSLFAPCIHFANIYSFDIQRATNQSPEYFWCHRDARCLLYYAQC